MTDPTPPNPDTLLARAQEDLDRGKTESARNRLQMYLAQNVYDPRFATMLGKIALTAGMPMEAGRWFWVAGQQTDASDPGLAVQQFLAHSDRAQKPSIELWAALPRALKGTKAPFPEAVTAALAARGIDAERARDKFQKQRAKAPHNSWLANLIGCTAMLVVLTLLTLGAFRAYEIVSGWLFG